MSEDTPQQRPNRDLAELSVASAAAQASPLDAVFEDVYAELRRLSGRHLDADPHATLSATGLVHEAYLKLNREKQWQDRAHFFRIAAQAMRQVLTDRARARYAQKRGGKQQAVTLKADLLVSEASEENVLAIDAALRQLEAYDKSLVQVVEMRFFSGLDMHEIAEVLDVSPRTAARKWARAKAHLAAFLA